jgi:PTH1 family peptidyl-tRNA hydrolase
MQPFSKKERPEVDLAVQQSIDIINSVFSLGLEKALSGVRV